MRYVIVFIPLLALLTLACNGGGEAQPTATQPTATATAPPGVERPDPQTLIPAGYVLDQTLELSLDGSEEGQLVIISHTAWRLGETTPDECPDNTVLGGAPSPCAFRVEVLAYDAATGWTSRYLRDDGVGEKPGAAGINQALRARSFELDASGQEALVLTYSVCAASNCVVEHHIVLTMANGEVEIVYDAFKASLDLGPASAEFRVLAYAEFSPGCCPNSILVQTVGLDPETGQVGVIDAELSLFCTEGLFLPFSEEQPLIVVVRCSEEEPATGYETTDETVVEPITVGGLDGLQEGDRISVEYFIKECPDSLRDCDAFSVTPVATKITVLSP